MKSIGIASRTAFTTNRYYDDITVHSPSGQNLVEAKSLDNAPKQKRRAFQSGLTYTCTDTGADKMLWTRKQAMEKPRTTGDYYEWAAEPSPNSVFLSVGGGDVLICVDVQGKDRANTSLLNSAFTGKEKKDYVPWTTSTQAGPRIRT